MSLKVCHISTMTNLGGVEIIVQDFLTSVKDSEIEHSLICTSYKKSIIDPIINADVKIYLPRRFFRYDVSLFIKMANWVLRNGIDIFHSYNASANNVANILSIITGIPFIGSEHGTVWQTKGLRFWMDRYAYRRSTWITANSESSRILLCHKYGLSKDKIRIIRNPVRIQSTSKTKDDIRKRIRINKKYVIGTICRLVPLKGVEIILKSAHLILKKRDDVQFLIVGDGEERNFLEKLNDNFKYKDDIIFLGWREDAREVLKSFDIFVNASARESFGNSMVEASSEGIPVVAPFIDGIPETVKNLKSGILISPTEKVSSKSGVRGKSVIAGKVTSPKAIAEEKLCSVLIDLMDNEKKRKELGRYGKEYSKIYSLDNYIANIKNLHNSILKKEN